MPNLASTHSCTGCGACDNICPYDAIELTANQEGFLMPYISYDRCMECKLCEKACPIVNGKKEFLKNGNPSKILAFWSKRYRTKSSSGGAFSEIAQYVLDINGIVFGASWHEEFKCKHTYAETVKALAELRGSKYVQSTIGDTYKQIKNELTTGRLVLFTGTPCQIAGLKSFLIKPYENLLCVDLVCHGVPSNQLFCNYVAKLKKRNPQFNSATGFGFRQLNGWGIAPSVKLPKSKENLTGINDVYMSAFSKGAIFRESCYSCQFNGLNRCGDITIADFWGIGKFGVPFRHDVSKGVSLIFVNTSKGNNVIRSLTDNGNCFVEERQLDEALRLNHNIVESSKLPDNRKEIIEAFNNPKTTLDEICNRFNLADNGFKGKVINLLSKMKLLYPIKSVYNKIIMIR